MRAGNLRHKVIFYAKVSTRGVYGDSIDTWVTPAITTRGELRHTGGSRTSSNEEKTYTRSAELIVRYRTDIVETMRVQIDDKPEWYFINAPIEEIGKHEGLRLSLEKIGDDIPSTLDPPTNFVAIPLSATTVGLEWINNTANDPVAIERSITGNIFTEIKRTEEAVTTYTDTGLTEETRYFYRIRAFNGGQYSTYTIVDDAMPMPVGSMAIRNFWVGTSTEYGNLGSYDEETLYVIQD